MHGGVESPYFTVELSGEVCLSELLTHLYVLVLVLDDDKHYWVGDEEVEKLLNKGEGWLPGTKRWTKPRSSLIRGLPVAGVAARLLPDVPCASPARAGA